MTNSEPTMRNLIFEYSQTSIIAGFHYIFEPKVSTLGKIFWLFLIVMLTILGTYMSIQNYMQWKDEPVITTLASTGLPISKVSFLSVVICSQGYTAEIIFTAYCKVVIEYMEKEKGFVNKDITPFTLGSIFYKRTIHKVNSHSVRAIQIILDTSLTYLILTLNPL